MDRNSRRIVTIIVLLLLSVATFQVFVRRASTFYLRIVPTDYATIQDAVDSAVPGDVVYVLNGVYCEHVNIDKTLTLLGEDRNNTIVDGNSTETVITIRADGVEMNGFTVRNSGNVSEKLAFPIDCGIKIAAQSDDVIVKDNFIMNNSVGIFAAQSLGVSIERNSFENNFGPPYNYSWAWNWSGYLPPQFTPVPVASDVFLVSSNNTSIANVPGVVTIYNSTLNTLASCGQVSMTYSDQNTLSRVSEKISLSYSNLNQIANSSGQIVLSYSNNNTLYGASGGVSLLKANHNLIEGNTLQPGSSIAEFLVPGPIPVNQGSTGNIIANNHLVNGSIELGFSYRWSADENVIENNTIVGGGIAISGSRNAVIRNNISGARTGIYISGYNYGSANNTASGNIVENSTVGFYVGGGQTRIEVCDNLARFNDMGMFSEASGIVSNNIIHDNFYGAYVSQGGKTMRENLLFNNRYSFIFTLSNIYSTQWVTRANDIDQSNLINGKPIYYLVNRSDLNINPYDYPEIGYLALVNCSNITVKDLYISGNGEGLDISDSFDITVESNHFENNLVGIQVSPSSSFIQISDNEIVSNWHGVTLSGFFNSVTDNVITNNTYRQAEAHYNEVIGSLPDKMASPIFYWLSDAYGYLGGLLLSQAENSTVANNLIIANEQGILFDRSSFNLLTNNSMIQNAQNFGISDHLFPSDWIFDPPTDPQISPYLANKVDTANTINGRPIYWWMNRQHEQVPTDAACLILIDSTGMILRNLEPENNTAGLLLIGVNDSAITDSEVYGSRCGIQIMPSFSTYPPQTASSISIANSSIRYNGIGIDLSAVNCTISDNMLGDNLASININPSSGNGHNLVFRNMISNDTLPSPETLTLGYIPAKYPRTYLSPPGVGISLRSANTTVSYNTIANNSLGVFIGWDAKDNAIYHNNFVTNERSIDFSSIYGGYSNSFDNGYPPGGNHWSELNLTDQFIGGYQNVTGPDGIDDIAYDLPHYNSDNFPLAAPISIFFLGTWNNRSYSIDIVSNSTISDTHLNPNEGALLRFKVTDEDNETGFCRVTIPRDLLTVENGCTILFGSEPINYTLQTDQDNAYLYFTFNRTQRTIYIIGTQVVPEFGPILFLLPIMIVSSALAGFWVRKRNEQRHQTPAYLLKKA